MMPRPHMKRTVLYCQASILCPPAFLTKPHIQTVALAPLQEIVDCQCYRQNAYLHM